MKINAQDLDFKLLGEAVRTCADRQVVIDNCMGQRYIASGLSDRHITINGTPGNALGAYLDGACLDIYGNAQDAVGDTMNEGEIIVHGSVGDAVGYGMRGGKIFILGNAGYRAGIHMKSYKEKQPIIIIGGNAASFLGEYLAGGSIIVLGLGSQNCPIGSFCGTGMHGGRIFLRCKNAPDALPAQVVCHKAEKEDMDSISSFINEFCTSFNLTEQDIYDSPFWVLTPNTKNPYKQLYTYI